MSQERTLLLVPFYEEVFEEGWIWLVSSYFEEVWGQLVSSHYDVMVDLQMFSS